jgi:hypothetical protein
MKKSNAVDKTIDYSSWETPASQYPRGKWGGIEIRDTKYPKGVYPFYGINGYEYYRVTKPLKITQLSVNGKHWMVDDPLHWYSMRDYVNNALSGHLLCAGLGLGLMLHWALKNPKLTRISVVERSEELIKFIDPLLPPHLIKIDYYVCDWHDFTEKHLLKQPDSILWDCAVGSSNDPATTVQFIRGAITAGREFPDVPYMAFGRNFRKGMWSNDLRDDLKQISYPLITTNEVML